MRTNYQYINPKVFGRRLSAAMKMRGMTDEKLAKEVECVVKSVWSWRKGIQIPFFDTIVGIADTLDVSIDFLSGRSDIMEIGGVHDA